MNARIIPLGMPFAQALRLGYVGEIRLAAYLRWRGAVTSYSIAEVEELLRYATPEQRERLDQLLLADRKQRIWRPLPGPQMLAAAPSPTGNDREQGGAK